MANFFITPQSDHDREKVMTIIRENSMTFSQSGLGHGSIEIEGSWNDFKYFETKINNMELRAHLETLSSELNN